MRERFDHDRGRWVSEEMGETVETLVRRRSGTDRWKADAGELRAVTKGSSIDYELVMISLASVVIGAILVFKIGFSAGGLLSMMPLPVVVMVFKHRQLKRILIERFGSEHGAPHVHVRYCRYDCYGIDTGVLFLEDDGALAFDGIASQWVLPPGAGIRTPHPNASAMSVTRVETIDGGRFLEIDSTGTWEKADPILAAYWAHPPTREIVEIPLSRQPGYGG